MKKCNKPCLACPYIKEGKVIKSENGKWTSYINKSVNCNTYNLVYMIECKKENCKKRYIGETERTLKNRLAEHLGYINTKKINQATGAHFSQTGHSRDDLSITIIE